MKLSAVPGMGEGLEMAIKPNQTARETPTPPHQPSQIVTQAGIAALNRVGLAFVGQR